MFCETVDIAERLSKYDKYVRPEGGKLGVVANKTTHQILKIETKLRIHRPSPWLRVFLGGLGFIRLDDAGFHFKNPGNKDSYTLRDLSVKSPLVCLGAGRVFIKQSFAGATEKIRLECSSLSQIFPVTSTAPYCTRLQITKQYAYLSTNSTHDHFNENKPK